MKIMKKSYLILAAIASVALASCSNEEYLGEGPNTTSNGIPNAINFNMGANKITRAEFTGAEAAKLLNKNFVVEGIKTVNDGSSDVVSEVFDNYNVNYLENTAATTLSNSANWEYVAQSILSGKTSVSEQSIKYWDFAAKQYEFWAYSLGGGSATVSTLAHNATLLTSAYTITGSASDLSKVYISDLVTAYNPNKTVSGVATGKTEPALMGQEVNLSFRSLTTKIRVGLYETIPGYSVRDVQFYPSTSGSPSGTVALYAADNVLPTFNSTTNTATYIVTFPTTGANNIGNSDYNKAHIALSSTDVASKVDFGTLAYGSHETGKHEKTGYTAAVDATPESWTDIWVQRSASTPTWAGTSTDGYQIVIPYETGAVLTLKVDYKLESTDGSGETIIVHGATALVPAQYTQWKSNYSYTYLFKISDNTNGLTNTAITDKVGLYPITLDAVVENTTTGNQETITTVATPSITTFSIGSNVVSNNEYTTSEDIYVVASTDGTLQSMTSKATLYDITKSTASYAATEAEVLAALTTYKTLESDTYTGRNSVVLTPVASALDLTKTTIPTVDGQTITITAGQAALIDKSKLTAGHTYAYVFNTTTGTPTTTDKYEAIAVTVGTTDVNGYYTFDGNDYTQITSSTLASEGVTYYDKYTEVTDAEYAIKVIKIKP